MCLNNKNLQTGSFCGKKSLTAEGKAFAVKFYLIVHFFFSFKHNGKNKSLLVGVGLGTTSAVPYCHCKSNTGEKRKSMENGG